MSDRKQKILLLCASSLAALVLVELALRVAGISFPLFYRYDSLVGSSMRPGAAGPYRREGDAFVSVNSDGLRDREHAHQKPPGIYRIAVIGDSFAEALQVQVEQTFWRVMERELQGCSALARKSVETINFGSSGYGTAQELLILRERALAYAPDLVVLAFANSSDFRNNVRELEKDPNRPYFVYRDGVLTLDDSFKNAPAFQRGMSLPVRMFHGLINSSRLIQVVHETMIHFKERRALATAGLIDPALMPELYREPTDPVWIETWRVTEGMLRIMRDDVRKAGAVFLVTIFSDHLQVNPDPKVRAAFMKRNGLDGDLFYPDRRLEKFGAREGIPTLALAPELLPAAEREHRYFHGFKNFVLGEGHYNEDGHREAGQRIAAKICSTLSSPAIPPGP